MSCYNVSYQKLQLAALVVSMPVFDPRRPTARHSTATEGGFSDRNTTGLDENSDVAFPILPCVRYIS